MFANAVFSGGEGARAVAVAAEEAGFDSIWTVEHVLVPENYESAYPYDESGKMAGGAVSFPIPDPLIWLAYVAAATTTIELATGILIVPQRNPAVLAKEVASLDVLSGGRVRLGIGVGWLAEEFANLGLPFDDRGPRTDAYVEAMRALWSGGPVTFDNGFVRYDRAISQPTPHGGRMVPIVVGGHTPAAARRAGRLGDGFFPAGGDLPSLLATMRAAAEAAGRDPDAIEITSGDPNIGGPPTVADVERFAAQGVQRMIVAPPAWDAASIGDALGAFGQSVIAETADL